MVLKFILEFNSFTLTKETKKGGIAPLQPAVLAAFRPWGIERGAGRTATAKIGKICPTATIACGLNRMLWLQTIKINGQYRNPKR